ncbi:heme-copper oxidase subunit III [Thermomicrobium sp. 4228-Ro]|uniref:cytochrome c oxidase subunit 3 n=1 Tax=Thermomicrobium sp. 4228-Ro TaxID=2993937 RepID=UPI0022490EDB|nr:heme-copper oxidase subunit III [Thermomicrobium sp. 4228-Ro]MCX2726187.1 heme-copper oxidase subunit III [Thermomicrobium sp. 4228-Ro]
MSHAQAAASHPVEEHTTTGISHNRLMMWTFLASDCMFFGSLIWVYFAYRGRYFEPPYPRDVLDIPYTSVSAAVLLLSSFAIVMALTALERADMKGFRGWLLGTILLGALFLGGQYYEFTTFYHEGLTLTSNLFGTTFFVLTGFHGTHVFIGIVWLLVQWLLSLFGKLTPAHVERFFVTTLYWHFVDIVWIIIFMLVYLMPY